jgi:hypothetical protein
MKVARPVALIAAMLIAAASLRAQEAVAELPVTPNTKLYAKIERTIIRIHSVFDRPLHPVISGVGPGGGWGAGVGYDAPGRGPWDFSAKAVYTLNNYWLAEAIGGYKGRRAAFEAFARAREMDQLDYYGSGPNSQLFNRTSYAYRDPVIGAHGKFRVTPWLALGARVEEIWPYARSGDRLPTIESRFFPSDAPALFAQPLYGRYQGSVDLHLPAGAGDAFYQGTKTRATYAMYDDQDTEQFNFRRLDVEAQQVFAGFAAHHRLTFSGWASTLTADAGQIIPFSLMPTLGGKSAIRSVHEDRLGSDGTDATLRGYRNLRFRDRNLLLLQAEYRVPLWGPIDATVFADAGKVAPTRSDLDLEDLRKDVGFSLSIMKGFSTWARVDVGFGSGEGTRVYFTLGELTP